MEDNWIEKDATLKFRIGEIVLFRIPLRLNISKLDFAELKANKVKPEPPRVKMPNSVVGFLIQSLPVSATLSPILFEKSVIRYVPSQFRRFFIDLDMSAENYLQKFSAKSRSTLKRKVRKFSKFSGGKIEWREYKNSEELEEFYRLSRQISINTYQEKLFDAGLPKSIKFQKQMLGLADQRRVRAYLLFHQGKAIAYLFLPVNTISLLYQHLGYDQNYAKWSPGTVLQWLVLEKLFNEREFDIFDFTGGEGAHKQFFATGSDTCADVYFLKRSFKNAVIVIAHFVFNMISDGIVQIVDKLGFKTKIKKYFRTR